MLLFLGLALLGRLCAPSPLGCVARTDIVEVAPDLSKRPRVFDPRFALGAGVDGHESGDNSLIYTPKNLREMRRAGLQSLTYRLRTELAIEAWHWNPRGRWSDARHHEGYWTSDTRAGGRLPVSYGYRLPRRGSTVDQANNDGYSRLDDGDRSTFWKSNPYLASHYTGEAGGAHPQWVVIQLAKATGIDGIEIAWANPYAVKFEVQYWSGSNTYDATDGDWKSFPNGVELHGRGGNEVRHLSSTPIRARYIRLWMTAGSLTSESAGTDVRDRLGFAIRELSVGYFLAGRLVDAIHHGKRGQTLMTVSSTDPWHRAVDRDRRVEQPSLDVVVNSGLASGLPILFPAPVLFGTPEDAAGLVRFLRSRRVPIRGIEMGEEPDGQVTSPGDYGALYLQVATAIHKVAPALLIGGPCFQTTESTFQVFPNPEGTPSWTTGLVQFLKQRHRLRDLVFFSLEWYPFDDVCGNTAEQLRLHASLLEETMTRVRREGAPTDIPWMVTEYGYSAFGGRPEVTLPGALMNAEIVGCGLRLGFRALYLYGYEPGALLDEKGCGSWGNNLLFLADQEGQASQRVATFWGAWLETHRWLMPQGEHRLYPTAQEMPETIDAFPVLRPDGVWAYLLLNKSPSEAVSVHLSGLGPKARLWRFGPSQYSWIDDGARSHPGRSLPPEPFVVASNGMITLPPYSLTVVVGSAPEPFGPRSGLAMNQ